MWTKVNKVSTWLVKQLEKRISIIRMWFTCKQKIFLLINIIFLQILQCCRIPWYISVPCSICSNNLCAEIQNHTYFPLLKIMHYWNISFKTKVGIERTIIAKLPVNTINHVFHIFLILIVMIYTLSSFYWNWLISKQWYHQIANKPFRLNNYDINNIALLFGRLYAVPASCVTSLYPILQPKSVKCDYIDLKS
jgi:hypothetical protein